jgi:hypothetical protein
MTSREQRLLGGIPSMKRKIQRTKNYNKKKALWKTQNRAINPFISVIYAVDARVRSAAGAWVCLVPIRPVLPGQQFVRRTGPGRLWKSSPSARFANGTSP